MLRLPVPSLLCLYRALRLCSPIPYVTNAFASPFALLGALPGVVYIYVPRVWWRFFFFSFPAISAVVAAAAAGDPTTPTPPLTAGLLTPLLAATRAEAVGTQGPTMLLPPCMANSTPLRGTVVAAVAAARGTVPSPSRSRTMLVVVVVAAVAGSNSGNAKLEALGKGGWRGRDLVARS